jgi:hypothetical protein
MPADLTAEGLGSDGLTRAEREAFLIEFRRGSGSRPLVDAEWVDRADSIRDKLAGTKSPLA